MITTVVGGKLYKIVSTYPDGMRSVRIISARDMLGADEALDEIHALVNEHNGGLSSLVHFDVKSKYGKQQPCIDHSTCSVCQPEIKLATQRRSMSSLSSLETVINISICFFFIVSVSTLFSEAEF